MAACYNTILAPAVEREAIIAGVASALEQLGRRIVHREVPEKCGDGYQYLSTQVIFVGCQDRSRWTLLSSWGDGLGAPFPSWYRTNPLALALSNFLSPVLYLFTYDAGLVAGYSIFDGGQQVEALSQWGTRNLTTTDFLPPLSSPRKPTLLGELLDDSAYDYESYSRGFANLEIATAALAARLGASVHLIDPLDVQDGEGAIVVEGTEYKRVRLPGWMALYYEAVAE